LFQELCIEPQQQEFDEETLTQANVNRFFEFVYSDGVSVEQLWLEMLSGEPDLLKQAG